jgi:hypothetical protein
MSGEEALDNPLPPGQSIYEQEVSELKDIMEYYETLRPPYKPNRADRRAMSKKARKKQTRDLRG